MPEPGASTTPDLAHATTRLESALVEFHSALKAHPLPRADGPVFNALRQWRTEQARAKQLPPYVIATDAVLRAIEQAKPSSVEELKLVRGVGAAKVNTYGDEILRVVTTATP